MDKLKKTVDVHNRQQTSTEESCLRARKRSLLSLQASTLPLQARVSGHVARSMATALRVNVVPAAHVQAVRSCSSASRSLHPGPFAACPLLPDRRRRCWLAAGGVAGAIGLGARRAPATPEPTVHRHVLRHHCQLGASFQSFRGPSSSAGQPSILPHRAHACPPDEVPAVRAPHARVHARVIRRSLDASQRSANRLGAHIVVVSSLSFRNVSVASSSCTGGGRPATPLPKPHIHPEYPLHTHTHTHALKSPSPTFSHGARSNSPPGQLCRRIRSLLRLWTKDLARRPPRSRSRLCTSAHQ